MQKRTINSAIKESLILGGKTDKQIHTEVTVEFGPFKADRISICRYALNRKIKQQQIIARTKKTKVPQLIKRIKEV
jgi:hypothetical protein